tara:strand:- start:11454 stop:12698 length:1245 start_codon:yes stop_codon:yes gene_type:complete
MNSNQLSQKNWSLTSKTIFRFTFCYFTLFILLLFLALFIETPLRWFADTILNWGADFKMESTGSGDRSFDYVRFALNLLLAFFTTFIWTLVGKKRNSYTTLLYWFQTVLRVFLVIAMIIYGLAKVFKGQFADPSLELLIQPVGEMSPMGLAWTFMGHSMVYNIFLGSLEIIGGLLLLNRKTVMLGSLVVLGIMVNVAFMNLTYDIPVKLFSIHLVIMASILLITNRKRILNFFFKNEAVEKIHLINYIKNTFLLKTIRFIKKTIIIVVTILVVIQCFFNFKATEQLRSSSKLRGIWKVETFVKQQDTIAPLLTNDDRWKYFIIDQKGKAVVKKMNNHIDRYSFEENSDTKEIVFKDDKNSLPQKFTYEVSNDQLKLQGDLNNNKLSIQLKNIPVSQFRLLNRKFHWVNESTYNY